MNLGTQIGQYRIVRLIGAGGMGAVFLGEHLLLKRLAAIKTLLPERARDRGVAERFFYEAQATSALADPGIVQVFDFGYHVDGTAYIVMEYLEGESLAARITRLGPLPLAMALRFGRQLAASLDVAHAAGVVHRDLKPSNIVLIRDAEAHGGERTKLLDFGVCGSPGTGHSAGTPMYMSPEQCRGEPVDERADVYALGCTMFHAIAGRPPFTGDTSAEHTQAHCSRLPEPPSTYRDDVPTEVDAIVMRCLAKEPDQRFRSMAELAAAIDEVFPSLTDSYEPAPGPSYEPAESPSHAPFVEEARSPYITSAPESAWFFEPPQVDSTDFEPPPRHRLRNAIALAVTTIGLGLGFIGMRALLEDNDAPAAAGDTARSPAIAPPPAAPPVAHPADTTPSVADLPHPAAEPTPPAPPPESKSPPAQPHVARPAPVRTRVAPPRSAASSHPPASTDSSNEDLYDSR